MGDHELAALLHQDRLVRLRDHPHLGRAARRFVSDGRARRVLPGLLVPAVGEDDLILLAAALTRYDPDAVLIEESAAALTFRATERPPTGPVRYASHRKLRSASTWFTTVRRRIDPQDVTEIGPVRLTHPALTAIDLARRDDAAAIDDVLRTGSATLDQLHEALARHTGRVGNPVRRLLLADSIGRPWSSGERRLHRLLRDAGIAGWRANRPVLLDTGRWAFLDVGFDAERLDLEVDGWRHHSAPADLAADTERQNALVLAGWLPYRITTGMLDDAEQLTAEIRLLLALRGRPGEISAAASAGRRRAGSPHR